MNISTTLCGRYNWTDYLADEGESINLAGVGKGSTVWAGRFVYLDLWTGT